VPKGRTKKTARQLDAWAGTLERAYTRRGELLRDGGTPTPSLDVLTGQGDGLPAETLILPVADLLYRGEAALDRADVVRAEISAILAEPIVSLDALRPWITELLDLVSLARDAA